MISRARPADAKLVCKRDALVATFEGGSLSINERVLHGAVI